MAILIKRYANRKLYNTDSSRYITLKGIAQLLDDGEEVRVIDNETGEDITQVALSQILVDSKRAKQDPSDTLLSQILARGGDALYGAIRKSVDEATDNLGDFQDRFRQFVNQSEPVTGSGRGFSFDKQTEANRKRWSGQASAEKDEDEALPGDLAQALRDALDDALDALDARDLPDRRDLKRLNRNLERVAEAIERLEALQSAGS
ncbi:MAG: hypothetical protein CL908_19100 [Deltaproteobacteria bacterium]|jgi:polyhydroxyalkanoate synthesis repressor PhaR|nr:hypothetical protein [Deltaproteobacteria bacterium]